MTSSVQGSPITMGAGNKLNVPDNPIVPFIEGDGTGRDIWRACVRVLDAAVEKAYGGKKQDRLATRSTPARRRSPSSTTGSPTRRSRRSASTSSASRARSPRPSAAASARSTSRSASCSTSTSASAPCAGSQGVPSPVKRPDDVDMVIFRENTEDIYAGIEFEAESADGARSSSPSSRRSSRRTSRRSASRRRPASASSRCRREGTERLVRAAIEYAIDNKRKSVTFVHKGNIMKFTEGAFLQLGLRPRRARVRRQGLHLGHVGEDQGREGRGRGERRAEGGARGGQGPRQGRHRRHHAPAGAHPPEGVRRHRHPEPERRLPLRRARGAGRRHRHRARRQHQLRHRPRHLRGHARHRAEVRRPRQGEPRLRRSSRAR